MTRLGAIDLATGQVHAWAPSLPWGCPVTAMEVVGPTLFVGACGLRAYDVATRAALPLTGQPSMAVHAEADGLGGIWVGGKASGDGDVHLRHIDANGFNVPYAVTDGPVDEIEAAGAELFLAGAFSEIAGERRWNLGSIDLSTGRATRFRPEPGTSPWVSNDVTMLEALPGGGLLVGGGSSTWPRPPSRAWPGSRRVARRARPHREDPHRSWPAVWPPARCSGSTAATSPATRRSRCAGSAVRARRAPTPGRWGGRTTCATPMPDTGCAPCSSRTTTPAARWKTAPGPLALGPKPFAIYPAYPYMYGEPRVGATLTMADGLWDPAPTSQRYTWTRCDYDVGCRPIPGATGRTYTTTSADAGQRIRATVYAINAAGERAFGAQEEIGPILTGPSSGQNWGEIPTPAFGSKVGDFLYGDRHIGSQSFSGRIGWLRCDASGADSTRLANELQAYELQPADQGHTFRQTLTTYTTSGESPERTSEPSRSALPTCRPRRRPPTRTRRRPPSDPARQLVADRHVDPRPDDHAGLARSDRDGITWPDNLAGPDRLPRSDALAGPDRDARPARRTPAGADPLTAARASGLAGDRTAPRVTATLLRDGRVRLRADAKGTVIVRVRDKKTKRVVARRTVKVAKGAQTVRVGKARRGVYVEVAWR